MNDWDEKFHFVTSLFYYLNESLTVVVKLVGYRVVHLTISVPCFVGLVFSEVIAVLSQS